MISTKMHILLVDDLNLIRKMLRQCLSEMGFLNVDDAADGDEALTKIRNAKESGTPYELVFLDWNMPNKTGMEVVEICRADPELKNLPIIMVTAEAEKRNVLKALMKGANDYIVKPVSVEILTAKMSNIAEQLKKKAG